MGTNYYLFTESKQLARMKSQSMAMLMQNMKSSMNLGLDMRYI